MPKPIRFKQARNRPINAKHSLAARRRARAHQRGELSGNGGVYQVLLSVSIIFEA